MPVKIVEFAWKLYLWVRTRDRLLFSLLLIWKCLLSCKKAIVVRRIDAIGDVVCTLPLCGQIKKENPDKLLVFITGHSIHRLVNMSKSCDWVYGACSGGFSVKAGFLGLVDKVYEPKIPDELGENGSKRHLIVELAASCGFSLEDRQPKLYPTQKDCLKALSRYGLSSAREAGEYQICINTGPTWPVRNWSDKKWQEVVDWIHQHHKATIYQLGYGGDDFIPLKGVKSLVGKGSVRDMACMISLCDLVISIDSGPIHIAGAVGTPVIGLFGAVNPAYRLPPEGKTLGLTADVPCLYCHHESPLGHWRIGCPHDVRCMSELSVEKVTQAVEHLLKLKAAPQPFA